MATRNPRIQHILGGGLASDLGASAQVQPQGNVAVIPFLREAKDIWFTLDGGVEKVGGTSLIGPTIGSDAIDSMFDYWYTSAGTAFQKRVIYTGTNLRADDGSGAFATISSTMQLEAKVHFSMYDEDLIVSSTSSAEVPQVYNGVTLETLGTNTPNFAFAEIHKQRLWAAGDMSAPSRLYYSKTLPDGPRGDWSDADSGSFDINPGDGDEITGLYSYKDSLFVFKGPNKGSIHRIEGASPTGSDPFARRDFLKHGLPVSSPNGFFEFNDDVGFVASDGTIHTLKSTAAFGDFNEAALSRGINQLIADRVNRSALFRVDAATSGERGLVLIAIPMDASNRPNKILAMDYRFDPPRWSILEDYDASSLAGHIDEQRGRRVGVMIGGSDAGVRRIDETMPRNEAAGGGSYTAITSRIRTPYLNYAGAQDRFTLQRLSLASSPDGVGTIDFEWKRDGQPSQLITLPSQASGDVLGSTFIMGTSALGHYETRNRHIALEDGGEFNQILYQIGNSTVNHRMEIRGFEVALSNPVDSVEN